VSDDPEALEDVFDMFGTMLLTSFDVLSEHGLLAADSPLPNIGIISLLMIEFVYDSASDFVLDWAHEVVRALDKAGVELKLRKEVRVSQEKIDEFRELYKEKESDEIEDGKNIYKVHGSVKGWEADYDCVRSGRIWARWDWKKEVCSLDDDLLLQDGWIMLTEIVCGVQDPSSGGRSLQSREVEQAA
jgi:hypothetical protein